MLGVRPVLPTDGERITACPKIVRPRPNGAWVDCARANAPWSTVANRPNSGRAADAGGGVEHRHRPPANGGELPGCREHGGVQAAPLEDRPGPFDRGAIRPVRLGAFGRAPVVLGPAIANRSLPASMGELREGVPRVRDDPTPYAHARAIEELIVPPRRRVRPPRPFHTHNAVQQRLPVRPHNPVVPRGESGKSPAWRFPQPCVRSG
jgi:hypothetical protein